MRTTRTKASDVKFTRIPDADGNRTLRAVLGGGVGGLLGAALGAGGGLISEAFLAKPEQAKYLRKAIQGAGIGALAGTGAGTLFGLSQTAADMHFDLNNILDDLKNSISEDIKSRHINVDHPILGRMELSLADESKSDKKRPTA